MDKQITVQENKSVIFKDINTSADQFIGYALVAYFIFGIALSFFYQTYLVGLGVGTLCMIAYFATKLILPESNLYQYVLGGVLAIFTAQFIYQMHGLFEMHFFVFVGSALLIAYQNWRLQLPLILLVVIHHGLFAFLQYAGNTEIYFTQLAYMDLSTFAVHGGLAAVIVAICGWWSFDLEKRTIREFYNTRVLEKQLSNVTVNISFAEEISKGNLEYKSNNQDTSDELGNALQKMQQSLFVASKREQEEKFITIGINKVSEILRSHSSNTQVLSDELIKGVVKYMNLNQGGIFLTEGEGADKHLTLAACYAYERKKFLQKRIELGEGLIGQCYLERDIVYLKDIPQAYIKITSGLGDAPPTNVLLVPIQTQDEIVGVLEIASFSELDENKIKFVKKICESIASSIVLARITEKVQKLLTESQQQTEELRAQEEEVRQNMEELSATQEEMKRKSTETESRIQAINESGVASIEFDPQGMILAANDSFLKLMGYSAHEVIGKHHRTFVEQSYAESQEYKAFWDDLGNGIPKPGEYQRITKSGTPVYIKGSYSIIRDHAGKVVRILKLVMDITEMKQKMMQWARQEENLKQGKQEVKVEQEPKPHLETQRKQNGQSTFSIL
jgi:methyl-accepting chemotaxis protein